MHPALYVTKENTDIGCSFSVCSDSAPTVDVIPIIRVPGFCKRGTRCLFVLHKN